jgi:hypothetical protein
MKIELTTDQLLRIFQEIVLENGRMRLALEAIDSVGDDGHLPAPGDFGVPMSWTDEKQRHVGEWCAKRARMGLGRE